MTNSMREELTQENDTEDRWKEYFEIREVGGDVRRERIGENEIVVKEC